MSDQSRSPDEPMEPETMRQSDGEADHAEPSEPSAPEEDGNAGALEAAGSPGEPVAVGDEAGERHVERVAPAAEAASEPIERELSRLTRRGLLAGAVAAAAGYGGWRWLQAQPRAGGIPWPFRAGLRWNERVWSTLYDPDRLAPTYPVSMAAARPRLNGGVGLEGTVDPESWRLRLEGVAGAEGPIELTLDAIRALPRVEQVTELKCIEGWSMFVHWGGARLADLVARYPPATRDGSPSDPVHHPERLVRYVALETPGRGYYVGLDMASALHPQTLLAYEINRQPLTNAHGAPLRLAIPLKYGIKNLKRIATIRFTDLRPPDFWGERGYDWYAGH